MPSRIALHPGHPLGQAVRVEVRLFQVPSFRRPWGRRASSGSWLRSRRSPMGRTAAACRCPGRSHGQTGMLTISSGLVNLSDTGLLLIGPSSGRCTIRNQDALTGLHPETDKCTRFHPVFLLSFDLSTDPLDTTLFLRTRICPCGCPRPRPPFERYFPFRPN